mmetsp:Transcript_122513/g.236249  ORF Transcript_122513/g.236249 Transcript_122513/m.236249 type:complete len:221 (-) Transcript_122513:85-747(-)
MSSELQICSPDGSVLCALTPEPAWLVADVKAAVEAAAGILPADQRLFQGACLLKDDQAVPDIPCWNPAGPNKLTLLRTVQAGRYASKPAADKAPVHEVVLCLEEEGRAEMYDYQVVEGTARRLTLSGSWEVDSNGNAVVRLRQCEEKSTKTTLERSIIFSHLSKGLSARFGMQLPPLIQLTPGQRMKHINWGLMGSSEWLSKAPRQAPCGSLICFLPCCK